MQEQRLICFYGSVQGVGFRWTTNRVASRFPVWGWVRNRSDGSVELVVEGELEVLDDFLQALRQAMVGNIRKETTQTAPAAGTLTGFEIRY